MLRKCIRFSHLCHVLHPGHITIHKVILHSGLVLILLLQTNDFEDCESTTFQRNDGIKEQGNL